MEGLLMGRRRWGRQGLGQGVQLPAAAGPHLGSAGRQAGEEPLHPFLNVGRGAEAGVGGGTVTLSFD